MWLLETYKPGSKSVLVGSNCTHFIEAATEFNLLEVAIANN